MDAFEDQILIKPRPDEDFYVFYSTLHFSPMEWGPRSDYEDLEDLAEDFERADKYGSSSNQDATFHWNDWNVEIRDGWAPGIVPDLAVAATIDREDLRELCESDVGAGFTVVPRSVKWSYATEQTEPPKLKVLIPRKEKGEDSLWFSGIVSLISLPLLLILIAAFLDSPTLTTPADWWGANGASLAGMGFVLLFAAFGTGTFVGTIRERRSRERAKLAWLEARRTRPAASAEDVARRRRNHAQKQPRPQNKKPSAIDEDEDLFGIGPRNWAGLSVLCVVVLLASLYPLFTIPPMLTGQTAYDGNVMLVSATMLAFSAGLASVIPHAFVSNDGSIPSLTDERYSVALFWYLAAMMAICAVLLALAPFLALFDGYSLDSVVRGLGYVSWEAIPVWIGGLLYYAVSATLFFFLVRGVWRRFSRPIPFRSYRRARLG
ncbi:hypothetical protein [Lysinibacter cavernae]|uniref:Uncharacterized protein n=1 Tax=Lysinibacter cavernae TaxID=1640652 RepID=A0A7X5R2X3_9MICO|nr:hypothetical protein [Lysinibacter cavernae]NIH54693.1 hypothetical protein [Lysinibacter cavernae]